MISNEEMLECLRSERGSQVIHEVLDIKMNQYGFYDVYVNMENRIFIPTMGIDTTVKNCKHTLPYPMEAYKKLTEQQQLDWRFNNK